MAEQAGSLARELGFADGEQARLERIEELLAVRMKDARKRHRHTLGVASTACELARVYDVDALSATAAGLLHDWDKVLPDDELVSRAIRYRIEVAGSVALAAPLLHGPVAARELPELFGDLPAGVFQAVARHTVGAQDMAPLDMVVFIADAIEPNRHGSYADALRAQVGKVSLEELFFACFTQGLVYVLQTGRYLYPTAIDIYNHYALGRFGAAAGSR